MTKATCDWEKPDAGSPLYYWYYTSQAKFHEGGNAWKSWNKQFSPTLMRNQTIVPKEQSGYVDNEGKAHATGSWLSPGVKEHNGSNKVMDTILCTLMLEVYYRYLPTFQPPSRDDDEPEIGDEEDELEIDIVESVPELQLPTLPSVVAWDDVAFDLS